MPLLVDALRPALGLILTDVVAEGGAFRIGDLDPVDESERLDRLGLDQPPDVRGKGRHLAHQIVEVEIGVVAEIFVGVLFEQPAGVASAAAAPHDPVDLRVLVEISDQRLRHPGRVVFCERREPFIRNFRLRPGGREKFGIFLPDPFAALLGLRHQAGDGEEILELALAVADGGFP